VGGYDPFHRYGAGFHNHHGRAAGRPAPVVFNGLIRDGSVVFNQKGCNAGHYDSVLEVPALDLKRLKKILDHAFLKDCAKRM